MRALVWFREDLRISDNKALHKACEFAEDGVGALFFVNSYFWQKHDMAPLRKAFLLQGVIELAKRLKEKNIQLDIINLEHPEQLYDKLLKYAENIKADALFFNKQYEINEHNRDEKVLSLFNQRGFKTFCFDDQTIIPPSAILNQTQEPYKVFTPYKRAWIKFIHEKGLPQCLPEPKPVKTIVSSFSEPTLEIESHPALHYWPAGENQALKRLSEFIDFKIANYHSQRDYPGLDSTSKLSPYLSTGMISPRQCFYKAIEYNNGDIDTGNKGATTWISEIIWRDFYKAILYYFPHVSKTRGFKKETDAIQWDTNEQLFDAWSTGQTGYPFVDAAMRQLKEKGWMHNRLRMVVAMFLTKNLFLDWRTGEKFFSLSLIDGDLSANNGGWQWCASTGVDAAPYFRIFNPILQSKRFDPQGDFIRQYCPEISHLGPEAIHEPWKNVDLFCQTPKYPKPIVTLNYAKEKVMSSFKNLTDK